MSNLVSAFSALENIRQKLNQSSAANKPVIKPQQTDYEAYASQIARNTVDQSLSNFRTKYGFPTKAPALTADILSYGGKVYSKAEIGNCMEVSCAAAYYLEKLKPVPAWDLVTIGAGDHVFVVLGAGAPAGSLYPADFSTWPADAAVCDVWADIACPATDFPARWKARMGNWDNIGRKIGTRGGPVLASTWADLVGGPKTSFTH